MARKKTNTLFIQEVHGLVGDEYVFLEEYAGAKRKIKCKHNTCGHEYYVTPTNFLTGKRCPDCYGTPKKKEDDFINEVYDLTKGEYEFQEKYINRSTKIMCKHNVCGFEWKIKPGNFLSGKRCPQCNRPNYYRDTKQFKQEVHNLVGNEYRVLGDYINAQTKIMMAHAYCDFEWGILPQHFLNGVRCPKCMGVLKKNTEQFNQEIFNLVGDEYVFLEDYINSLTKITCRHNECGHTWKIAPSNFLSGRRCPQCNESKGEQVIREYFEYQKVPFIREYSFDKLVGVGGEPLRFDFAVFKNNDLQFLIEYDGEFHFEKQYKGDSFEDLQVHDSRKNQYCKSNNIPLLRIPYWKFDNIEHVLTEWLVDYNLL